MPESQDPNKVSNNDLRNAQFGGGLINAETVNAQRIGGDIWNFFFEQQTTTSVLMSIKLLDLLVSPGKFFDYLERRELKRLNENVTIKEIKTSYGDLQIKAWKLFCVGRAEGSALQDKAIKAWLKYMQLYYLWNEFEEANMTPLEAIEKRIEELNNQIATFQAKSAQIDELSARVQKAQEAANSANSLAAAAQITANNALTGSVKNIKFFIREVAIDTRQAESNTVVTFPERVDAVVLESIINDGHDMWVGRIDRINENSFKVTFKSARGESVHWIPSLRFVGIQVQR